MSSIKPITMPKWGLSMEEGMLAGWIAEDGATIEVGQEILDIETDKIANGFESPVAGKLRRVVDAGQTVPVGALLGVASTPDVADAEIDDYVADFLANFDASEKQEESGPEPELVDAGAYRIRRLRAGADGVRPMLLIHGFGADLGSWMFNQAELAGERQVDAIDLPGHGGSTKEVTDGSVEALADAVLA